MRYIDIEHLTLETTNNLSAIPGDVLGYMLAEEWAYYLPSSARPLPDIAHPRIDCITHITYNYVDKGNWVSDYKVCTVLVDGKAAFFFVSRVEYDCITVDTFVLDMPVVKVFLGLIVQLALKATTPDSMCFSHLVDEFEVVHTFKPLEELLA